MTKAYLNARIFTGSRWLEGHAVIIEEGQIAKICAESEIQKDCTVDDLGGGILAPGFIDIQVNGGGGLLLNEATTLDDLETIATAHRRFGTTSLIPTLITDGWERMTQVAALIREAIAVNLPGIRGVHFEGPYLNEERKGVHDANYIRGLEAEFIDLITAGDLGSVVVTLAPERVPPEIITQLVEAGIRVSAGHSNASYEQARDALEAGLSGFTHLYNAMPPMLKRAPGIVGAALNDRNSFCGIINDGHHVHPAVLKAAIAARGADHMMLVTDAMAAVGTDLTHFSLGKQEIWVKDGRCETENGTLAGSHLDMAAAVRNAVTLLDQPIETALNMASGVPARFLGLDKILGRIAEGYAADMVLLDADFAVKKSWIAGR